MGEFSISHLLIVGVILLIFFGPSRLPGLGQSLGKAIRGFKEGINDIAPPESPPDREGGPAKRTEGLKTSPDAHIAEVEHHNEPKPTHRS